MQINSQQSNGATAPTIIRLELHNSVMVQEIHWAISSRIETLIERATKEAADTSFQPTPPDTKKRLGWLQEVHSELMVALIEYSK
ncbi:MAG: hypothetical protein JWP57_3676 [Spirosoma sp.]|nr:hypothetical protein [Spirosoma sp.]